MQRLLQNLVFFVVAVNVTQVVIIVPAFYVYVTFITKFFADVADDK